MRNIPDPHLYYLLTGAVATIFVLAPECRLLTGMDPVDPIEVERHVDAVISMLFVSMTREEEPSSRVAAHQP